MAATPQASSPASQDASNIASLPEGKPQAKSYRFSVAHNRRFAAWATFHGLTEQEATRLGQLLIMEQYATLGEWIKQQQEGATP